MYFQDRDIEWKDNIILFKVEFCKDRYCTNLVLPYNRARYWNNIIKILNI